MPRRSKLPWTSMVSTMSKSMFVLLTRVPSMHSKFWHRWLSGHHARPLSLLPVEATDLVLLQEPTLPFQSSIVHQHLIHQHFPTTFGHHFGCRRELDVRPFLVLKMPLNLLPTSSPIPDHLFGPRFEPNKLTPSSKWSMMILTLLFDRSPSIWLMWFDFIDTSSFSWYILLPLIHLPFLGTSFFPWLYSEYQWIFHLVSLYLSETLIEMIVTQ